MLLQVDQEHKDSIEILQVVFQALQDVSNVIIPLLLVVVLEGMAVSLTLQLLLHLVQPILVPLTGLCIQKHHRILLQPIVFIYLVIRYRQVKQ